MKPSVSGARYRLEQLRDTPYDDWANEIEAVLDALHIFASSVYEWYDVDVEILDKDSGRYPENRISAFMELLEKRVDGFTKPQRRKR